MNHERLKLKVCGMRSRQNIAEVAAFRPDLMGFIFYEKSPRFVGLNFRLPKLDPTIVKVGVFAQQPVEFVSGMVAQYQLGTVQLHGGESTEFCQKLRDQGISVVKVFSVDENFDYSITKDFHDASDYFLFDTKVKHYGGNARAFDWASLNQYDQQTPFFLSGGLTASNINHVKELRKLNLIGLDVNSGIESSPGEKDIKLLNVFMNEFKQIAS